MAFTKEQRKKYNKKYNLKNAERIKELKKQWQQKNREKVNAHQRKYYKTHKKKTRLWRKKYYIKNKEKIMEWQKKWRAKNPDKVKAAQKRFEEAHERKKIFRNYCWGIRCYCGFGIKVSNYNEIRRRRGEIKCPNCNMRIAKSDMMDAIKIPRKMEQYGHRKEKQESIHA